MHTKATGTKPVNRERQRFLIVSFIGLVYFLTGALTYSYPPDYFAIPRVWAAVFVMAGCLAWISLAHPTVWLATVSGGMLVGSALFRAGAIFAELGWTRLWRTALTAGERPLSSSFFIAGMTWTLIAVLLWAGWPQIQAGIIRSKNDE